MEFPTIPSYVTGLGLSLLFLLLPWLDWSGLGQAARLTAAAAAAGAGVLSLSAHFLVAGAQAYIISFPLSRTLPVCQSQKNKIK